MTIRLEDELLRQALTQSIDRIRKNIAIFGDRFPYVGEGSVYILGDNDHWMTSFWTGQLWLAYAITEDGAFRREAEEHLSSFRHRLKEGVHINHDLGFLYTLSARAQWQLTENEDARKLALSAADRLAERFNPRGEYIQAWGAIGDPNEGGRTIVDTMMNIPLLFWASSETSESAYREIATRHAYTTARHIIRPDGSSYHTFYFDQATGEPIGPKTHQGYADDSLWARGQAWAIYGFSIAADWTGNNDFNKTAAQAAERFLEEITSDYVPLWDLRLPADAPQYRDSSAGAIAAAGLLKLAEISSDRTHAERYRAEAQKLIRSLTRVCFDTSLQAQGLLRDATYNANRDYVEEFTLFGDYFYLEALTALNGTEIDFWGKRRSRKY